MLKWLPFFIIVPVIELFVLFSVADVIGFFWTLALIVLTAFVGLRLLKQQGLDTLKRFQRKAQQSELPIHELAEGMLLFFAGGLLLTPGLITDVMGFLILIPVTRQGMVKLFAQRLKSSTVVSGFGQTSSVFGQPSGAPFKRGASGDVIEAEYEDVTQRSNDTP